MPVGLWKGLCAIGSPHDLARGVGIVVHDVGTPIAHNPFHSPTGVGFRFVGGVYRPPALDALAEGVEEGALLLVEGQGSEHGRLQHGIVGQDAVVGDGLLGAVVVHHGVVRRFASRPCRRRKGDKGEFISLTL